MLASYQQRSKLNLLQNAVADILCNSRVSESRMSDLQSSSAHTFNVFNIMPHVDTHVTVMSTVC